MRVRAEGGRVRSHLHTKNQAAEITKEEGIVEPWAEHRSTGTAGVPRKRRDRSLAQRRDRQPWSVVRRLPSTPYCIEFLFVVRPARDLQSEQEVISFCTICPLSVREACGPFLRTICMWVF